MSKFLKNMSILCVCLFYVVFYVLGGLPDTKNTGTHGPGGPDPYPFLSKEPKCPFSWDSFQELIIPFLLNRSDYYHP